MNYEDLKNKIETVIRDNNTGDITAEKMRELLSEMIDTIDLNHRKDITSLFNSVDRNKNNIQTLQDHDNEDRLKMPIFFDFTMSAVNSDRDGGTARIVLYSVPSKCFCVQVGSSDFSAVWNNSALYNSREGYAHKNRLFINTPGEPYYFDGSDLRPVFETIKGRYNSMELKKMMLKGELLPGFWYQVSNYLEYSKEQLAAAGASILETRYPFQLLIKAETSHSFARKAKFITDNEVIRDTVSLNEWDVEFDIFGEGHALTGVPAQQPDVIGRYVLNSPLYKGDVTVFSSPLGYIYQPGTYKEFQEAEWGMCIEIPVGFTPITKPVFSAVDYRTYAPIHCGVVTRMKDHRGNEAPFDFWHIGPGVPAIVFNNIEGHSELRITNNIIKPCKIDRLFAIPPASLVSPVVIGNVIELDFGSSPLTVNFQAINNTITNSMIEGSTAMQNSTLVNCSLLNANVLDCQLQDLSILSKNIQTIVANCDIKGGIYFNCVFRRDLVLRADNNVEVYGLEITNSGYVTPQGVVPFATDTIAFTVNGPANAFSARRGITWLEYVIAAKNPQLVALPDRIHFQNKPIAYSVTGSGTLAVQPTDVIIGIDIQPAGYVFLT